MYLVIDLIAFNGLKKKKKSKLIFDFNHRSEDSDLPLQPGTKRRWEASSDTVIDVDGVNDDPNSRGNRTQRGGNSISSLPSMTPATGFVQAALKNAPQENPKEKVLFVVKLKDVYIGSADVYALESKKIKSHLELVVYTEENDSTYPRICVVFYLPTRLFLYLKVCVLITNSNFLIGFCGH